MSTSTESGTLVVVVLKARNLIDKHTFYKQDVFAQAVLNGITKKTHVDVKGGQHPVWDSEQRFTIMKTISDKTRKLEVSCYAKEHRSDELLGKGTVDITETLKTGEFDDWVSLDIDGVVRGELYLEMTFFSSGPGPGPTISKPQAKPTSLTIPHGQGLSRRPSKLSPSERLYRLPQSLNPPPVLSAKADRPPSSVPTAGSHSPSKRKDSPLPSLPETQLGQARLPGSLQPGGTLQIKSQGSPPDSGPLPSSLRPGNGNAFVPSPRPPDHPHRLSPSHSPIPTNSGSLGQSTPSFGSSQYNPSSSSNPYLSSSAPAPSINPVKPITNIATAQTVNYPIYNNSFIPSSVPPGWDDTNGHTSDFSFPMPMIPPPISQPDLPQAAPHHTHVSHQAMPGAYSTPPPSTRYTTPLPLPLGAEPNLTSGPPRGQQPTIKPAPDRIDKLKKVEDKASKRREQELKDLELALQLDKELNT